MENSQAMIEEKRLGFFDLLKESLKIPIRNPNFIIFAFFSSLPLFSFLIMYETVFQQTMIKILKSISQERTILLILKGPLITSIYALLLDSLVSVGLVSMVMYICLGSISSFFSMVFSVVFLGLLSKYIEWSAVWNMGILISILEDKHGDVALIISAYRTRGSRQQGFLLMLVFFAWRLALRSAFIYVGWDGGGRGVAVTIVHASLVCSAKMWLWLVFIVYFYDCQKKSLRRKNDVEGGQEET
ncbi:Transmembrane protein [Salix suchowensis]|nr:Transmembrane protein [Salix suchowensis]